MKKYVITAVLFFCLSQYSFPQNNVIPLIPENAVRIPEASLQMNKLFPSMPAASGVHTPYDVFNLPGIRENIPDDFLSRLKSNSYVPVKVTVDDTIRIIYTYNSNGYLESTTKQALRGGEWVNLNRSSSEYGPDNKVLVSNTEVWENGEWKLKTKQTITYNTEGRTETVIFESFSEPIIFSITTRTSYSYDQAGNVSSILKERWLNRSWVNYTRTSYIRNSAGRYLNYIDEEWKGTEWQINSKITYTYDENNNLAVMLSQRNENGELKNTQRQIYTYDNQNHLTSYTIESLVNGNLQYVSRCSYEYSGDTRISLTIERWSGTNNTWNPDSRHHYTYQGPNIILTIAEKYKNNAWEISGRNENVYDENNNLISEIFLGWNGTEWENQQRTTCAYDGKNILWSQTESGSGQTWTNWSRKEYIYTDGNAVEGKNLLWKDNTWKPSPGIIYMYFNNSANYNCYENAAVVRAEYSPATGVEEESNSKAKEFSLSQNYPNPFNPSTTISYSLKSEGNVKLTVYDVLGTKITELVNEFQSSGSHTVKFNASGLSSGIYLYRLESQGMSAVRKLLLLK